MSVTQTEFTGAILDPDAPAPTGLTDPAGRPADRRFDVYRNNVAVSLTEALETSFPVLRKLIGTENFKSLAGVFLRRHPPGSALMMHYGDAMPDFLETFAPLRDLGYLPDIARLENLLRASYHAADATPVEPARLRGIPPDRLLGACLALAPAVRVLRSSWPVHAIWSFNTQPDAAKPRMRAEDVLIVRPEFDPEIILLPDGGAAFVGALMSGRALSEALDAASQTVSEFDLASMLGHLLSSNAIAKIEA